MNATRHAFSVEPWPDRSAIEPQEAAAAPHAAQVAKPLNATTGPQLVTAAPAVVPELPRTPALRVLPLLSSSLPRQFVRVPTHAVGVHPEQRQYPRAKLRLSLRLRAVGGVPEKYPNFFDAREELERVQFKGRRMLWQDSCSRILRTFTFGPAAGAFNARHPLKLEEVEAVLDQLGIGSGDRLSIHSHSAVLAQVQGGIIALLEHLKQRVN